MSNTRQDEKRVVVGVSGGVDSAVAAALLQKQGFEVHAVALQTWRAPYIQKADPTLMNAQKVAEALAVPFHTLDVQAEFYQSVVHPFITAYTQGQTPNPCVVCNPQIKFEALLDVAEQVGARWIATGHYAQVEHGTGQPSRLLRARHHEKDQAYVLYRLTQRHLTRLLLPLSHIPDKATVRQTAQDLGLPSAQQRDSQDLCFLEAGDYRALLRALCPDQIHPGPIYNEAGHEVGQHQGLPYYTVGQRHGLGISAAQRLYVLRLDPSRNALIVGPREHLDRRGCTLSALTFTTHAPETSPFTAQARIRYRAPLISVRVVLLHQTSRLQAKVTFQTPQRGVTPGQSLVLYQGQEVIGGGIIRGCHLTQSALQ